MFELIILFLTILFLVASGVSYYRRGLEKFTYAFFFIGIYVAALIEPRRFFPAFTFLLIGNFVGLACHEYSHYFISRIWMDSNDLRVNLKNMSTEFDSPYSAPTWGIRIIAGVPYVLMLILAGTYYIVYGYPNFSLTSINSFISVGVVAFLMGLGIGVSPSDILGILFPSKFQEFAENNTEKNPMSAWNILKSSLRENGNL